jgi:hypothetical protein
MARIKVFHGLVTGHPTAIQATALYLVGEQPRNVHALERVQLPNYTTVYAAVIPSDPTLGASGTTFEIAEDGSEWLEAVHAEAAEDVARLRHAADSAAYWSAAAIATANVGGRRRGTALSRARDQDRDTE